MKIALVGKGGAGKTTLTALLARWLSFRGYPVLALDADRNQHLGCALGIDPEALQHIRPLGPALESVREYLESEPRRTFFRLNEPNPKLEGFEEYAGGVRLLTVGGPQRDEVGRPECFRGPEAVELFFDHLADTENEYVLADMMAGTETFSSGLFTRFDLTLVVCEPTPRAVSVFRQYRDLSENQAVRLRVLGNKVADKYDVQFLLKETGEDLITCFSFSEALERPELRGGWVLEELEAGNQDALALVQKELEHCGRELRELPEPAATLRERYEGNARSPRDVRPAKERAVSPEEELERIYVEGSASTIG